MAEKKKTILDEAVVKYKYILKEFNVNIPGKKPIAIKPMHVASMMLERDFVYDYFPILKMTCHFEPLLREEIIKNRTKVTFHVRLQKRPLSEDPTKTLPAKDVFNKVFAIFPQDSDPFYDKKKYLASKGGGTKVEEHNLTPKDFGVPMDFYLFPDKELGATKKIHNKVFSSISMTDALVYILGSSGFSKILMAPLENNKSFKQVVIPPMPALEAIEHLERIYGFYNDGSMIFFDYDRGYIIPYNPLCKAWEKQEYKEVVLLSKAPGNSTVMAKGTLDYSKEKKFLVGVPPGTLSMSTDNIMGDHIIGNKIMAIDNRSGTITNASGKTEQRGSGNTRVIMNKYGNKFYTNALARMRSAGNKIVTITLTDHDIDVFKPNRSYKLIFEQGTLNSDAGGTYMLAKTISTFIKNSSREFEIKSAIFLNT